MLSLGWHRLEPRRALEEGLQRGRQRRAIVGGADVEHLVLLRLAHGVPLGQINAVLVGEPCSQDLVERPVVVGAQDALVDLVLSSSAEEADGLLGQPWHKLLLKHLLAALAAQQEAHSRFVGQVGRRHGQLQLQQVELQRRRIKREDARDRRVQKRRQCRVGTARDHRYAQRVGRRLQAVEASHLDAEVFVVGDEHELGLGGCGHDTWPAR
mmetsp:Transcript_29568/g.69056  ORF Transcript_29568/g.69056 Transcript_29568/m.69056 type:complete len:211 (-) Transcript_29568:67-699(-)